MKSVEEKFKNVASQYRLITGRMWTVFCERDFIASLNSIEKKNFGTFFPELIEKGYFVIKDSELYLTEAGEVFIYGNDNDPTSKILKEICNLGMSEGSCWQFSSYVSFKSSLNPVEEKNFDQAINKLVEKGLLKRNEFDGILILTKLGEEVITEMFLSY